MFNTGLLLSPRVSLTPNALFFVIPAQAGIQSCLQATIPLKDLLDTRISTQDDGFKHLTIRNPSVGWDPVTL